MFFKASLDTLSKVITIACLVIFAGSAAGIGTLMWSPGVSTPGVIGFGFLVLFMIGVPAGCYLYAPKGYRIDTDALVVVRPAGDKKILFSDIAEIRPMSPGEMGRTLRTFGNGGLFGYYGKYYNRTLGNFTIYATRRDRYLLVRTKQMKSIVITPDDAGILCHLQKALHPGR
jgi:hypothetical protein